MSEQENNGRVEDLLINDELQDSYLSYAMSVIVSRALPDARDGLKPSQRRILMAMNDLNLGPRSKHRKCAKIAGDTSGNYHPHGESVIYPTLVRMAQDFNTRYLLVEGWGNFGSQDGDGPAAMRYTEARMGQASSNMMEDLKRDTVDMVPTYDGFRREPTVLPGKFPNLLCNGSNGIAVGMATSIPPHNVKEVCSAIRHLLDNPQCSIGELIQLVPGPDFPTGGIICGRKGVVSAYGTGRGHILVKSRSHIEEDKKGNQTIVITEIPYQVAKGRLLEKIAEEHTKGERLKGIRNIRDLSNRKGMRIEIQLKSGEDADVVLNQLYKCTPLRTTVSFIMIALVDGRPRTLNLKESLSSYIDHRREVIRRRTRFLLKEAEARAHILEGLRVAVQNIDDVVKIIKESADPNTARDTLQQRFDLSQIQAQAILDMRLARLTGLEIEKLEKEYQELQEAMADYRDILARDERVKDLIRDDLGEVIAQHGDDRRTTIDDQEAEDIDMADLVQEAPMIVTLSDEGYVKRLHTNTYREQRRGGRGVIGAKLKEGDVPKQMLVASTHDTLLFFTDKGRVHWRRTYEIPETSRTARGRAVTNLLNLEQGEAVTSILPVDSFEREDLFVVMATGQGVIKKTALKAYSNPRAAGIKAIVLDDGDELIGAKLVSGEQHIILATAQGQAIRFPHEKVRAMGRVARGVGGIQLSSEDQVVSLLTPSDANSILTVCAGGYGKQTAVSEYRVTNRNGKGIINIKTSSRNGQVVACREVTPEDQVLITTQKGMVVRTAVEGISQMGRATQGVKLVDLKDEDCVIALAVTQAEDEVPGDDHES